MNVLLITSDQHNKFVMGCAGDPMVQTPALDALAAQGTRFTAAYTNNPICMPARATLATGQYGHAFGAIDNGSAYDGTTPSWGHRLQAAGADAITFGKLHFLPGFDHGFDSRLPLQATAGYGGALLGWARGDAPAGRAMRRNVDEARPGEFEYTTYDRYTAASAESWLQNDAPRDRPWAAHVSFAYPHYPFRVPASYLEEFSPAEIELPPDWHCDDWPDHPAMAQRRSKQMFDSPPIDEATLRNMRWVYYGMVAFLDELVGQVLAALDSSDMADDTLVIYTSDHGDMLGEKGLFMKGLMYEGSAGIPMVMRGPGVLAGEECDTPVSLVDVPATILDTVLSPAQPGGLKVTDDELPGHSLTSLSASDGDRLVFSEYHGPQSSGANFMIRRGSTKYVEYLADGMAPQLFDLAEDPREQVDRASDSPATVADMAAALRTIVPNPEELNASILEAQRNQLAAAGGLDALRGPGAGWAGDPRRLPGYSRPSDDVMAIVGWPNDPDWDQPGDA